MAAAATTRAAERGASLQAARANQQAILAAKLAPHPAGAKPTAKKKPTKTKPGGAKTPSGPEVAPFYDSDALLAIGERNSDRETANADMGADYAAQAAQATRGIQEAEIGRVEGSERAKTSMAARGLAQSSIRDGALDTVDAEAARKVAGLQGDLAVKALQNGEARKRGSADDATFMSAMAARAAENAGGVVRDPRGAPTNTTAKPKRPAKKAAPARATSGGHMQSPARAAQQALAQKRAGNVKGSATLRKGRGR
jgi:hypothetical protein